MQRMFESIRNESATECEGRGVAARLRSLRLDVGWTQADLARVLGTTQSAVARMESGNQRFNLDSLKRVADALGCQVAVVFEQERRSA